MTRRRAPVRVALIALLAALCAAPAHAQHFGRNKVQYETFDFQVSSSKTFDIYFYPATQDVIPMAARMAERWNERLQRMLDHRLSSRQPLILYAAPAHFQQTNVIGGSLGEGTGGVTESLRRRVVMPFAGPLADTDHVLGHELVHAYQYDMATAVAMRSGQSGMAGMAGLPLWFIEGMAEYLSVGRESPLTAMWLRDAIVREKLPRVRDLANPEYFPYRWGQALWAYIGGRWGDGAVRDMLVAGLSSGDPEAAIQSVLGVDEETLSADWHAALQQHFGDAARATRPMSAFGQRLTEPARLGGAINVSPSVSPDGTRVAFLSERDIFSIDLYVADARTGQVIRRLTRTAIDPHFSSLQFIASAGTWSPDGTRLAVTAIAAGRPELAIYDVASGRLAQRRRLDAVDAALQPAWAPDGRSIAFVGQRGGVTDLFLVDVDSGTVTPLTDDAYTELHPAWAPDGRQLAFATDRFTTNLDTLAFGDLRLGVMATDTRQVRPIQAFATAKHINPQWTPDGAALVFIAEPDGISNVYRVSLDGGTPSRVTDVFTGISGITATSPALSVASRTGTTVVTAYEDGNHVLYRLEDGRLTGAPLPVPDRPSTAGVLPPVRGTGPESGVVSALLGNATLGLPPATTSIETEPYSPNLKLDFVGQPSVANGADRWGAFGGGALSFFMSDMLGDHSLGVAVQSNTSFNGEFSGSDIGGGIVYRNLKRRWNWGIMADQSPYRSGYAGAGVSLVDGTPALVEQSVIFRQVDRGVSGLLEYPFSEAQRVEFSAGMRNLGFSQRVYTQAYDLETGQLLLDEREDLSPGDGITFGHASAALVYDTSSFGATSPVLGQRYRLEAAPTFGDLTYTGVLADYRRYFMPIQFYTIAFRAMHYGRYGSSAEDPRLVPLFVGYPHLMRGYDIGTFEAQECPPAADGRCPALDRLLGSRIAVANLELRFPLLRPFGVRRSMYGPIPVEAALFADAGTAWDSGNEQNPFYRSDARTVTSAGLALRVNALGFAVVQISYTRPFQRKDRGWVWQFSLAPGF
jgi:hypothetical protein